MILEYTRQYIFSRKRAIQCHCASHSGNSMQNAICTYAQACSERTHWNEWRKKPKGVYGESKLHLMRQDSMSLGHLP